MNAKQPENTLQLIMVQSEDIDQLNTGYAVRTARLAKGLTLREVASQAGHKASWLFDLESGRRLWTKENFEKVKAALNCTKAVPNDQLQTQVS